MLDKVSKLAKLLASDELKTRKRGYRYVCELLSLEPGSNQFSMSFKDMLGVCKGLYYSLWMQDKLLLQEEAVARIAKLISISKSRGTRGMYVKAMFETLSREWDNLDSWREDKFMMLARVFFVSCIGSVKRRRVSIETLANAVYEGVINDNINSAIGLKLHLCLVIQQELPNAGEIPAVVHSFFTRTVETLQAIPKGSVYASELVKLLLFLTRQMRRYPNLPLNEISDEMLVSSTKIATHRKTLRRIAVMLYTETSKASEERNSIETLPNLNDAESNSTVALPAATTAPTRKRRLDESLSTNLGASPDISSHRPKRKKKAGGSSPTLDQKAESQGTVEVDGDAKGDVSMILSSSTSGELGGVETKPESDLSVMDQVPLIPEKKRVSFGKVVCRRFSARRILGIRSIKLTKPDRSILRR